MTPSLSPQASRPLFSTRKIVHLSMLGFAFLLPFLTWLQAAGAAVLALLFNLLILPRLEVDLGKGLAPAGGSPARPAPRPSLWTGIVLYPLSVLVLILLFRREMHIVAAVWAVMALGDGLAGVVGGAAGGAKLPYNPEKTRSGFLTFVVAGTIGAYVLTRWVNGALDPGKVWIVCGATAVVGALVESLPIRLDDNASVPLVSGAFMFAAYLIERSALDSNLPYLGRRIILAVAINLVFALAALGLKLVNRSGAVAGWLLGITIYMGYGYKSFLLLLAFFALGSVATRLGYAKKAARGIAERRRGARSWREATANTVAAAFCSILVITTHYESAFLVALIAALAEAAGDTVSSEIGQWVSGRAYLITTLQPVPAGEDGGLSLPGTLAGVFASTIIVAVGYALGLARPGGAWIALAAGVAGNLFDSVLGATIERRGLVTNSIVNFAGTSFAAALAFGLFVHLLG